MKITTIIRPLTFALCLLASVLCLPAPAQDATAPDTSVAQSRPIQNPESKIQNLSGAIRGQVSNQTTKQVLANANLTLLETKQTTITDEQGNFMFAHLPPGVYTVQVDYPGLDTMKQTVTVGATTANADIQMNSEIYQMAKFTVSGEREGNASAIAQQRASTTLVNVVTTDAFGEIPKGNIANFLNRIPGIVATTSEVDPSDISIRGMDSNYTTINVDGVRGASGGGGREQDAAAFPTDMIERVEVIKVPTPDVETDAIGGTVNLITKSAFDRTGRTLRLRVGSSYSFTYGKSVAYDASSWLAPILNLDYGQVFSVFGGQRNLGITFNANWKRTMDVRGTTSWANSDPDPAGTIDPATGAAVRYRRFQNATTSLQGRDGGGAMLKAEYKFSPNFSITANLRYSNAGNNMYRARNLLYGGNTDFNLSTPDYVVVNGANYGIELSDRTRYENTYTGQLDFLYNDKASKLTIKGSIYDTKAHRHEYMNGNSLTLYSAQKINYALDRRAGYVDQRWPAIRVLSERYMGSNPIVAGTQYTSMDINPFADDLSAVATSTQNLTEYYVATDANGVNSVASRNVAALNVNNTTLEWRHTYTDNPIFGGKVDITKDIAWIIPIRFKTGLSYKAETNTSWQSDLRGRILTDPDNFGSNLSSLIDPTWNFQGGLGHYPAGDMISSDKITSALGIKLVGGTGDPATDWAYNPKYFWVDANATRSNTLRNDRTITERNYQTYFSGEVKLTNSLKIVGGARLIHIENTRTQPLSDGRIYAGDPNDPNFDLSSALIVGTVKQYSGHATNSRTYNRVNPSIQINWTPIKQIKVVAAYTTQSSQPNWNSIVGSGDVDYTTKTVTTPNLDLKPRDVKSWDLQIEWYPTRMSAITVGVYQKSIKNYELTGYQAISPYQAQELGASPPDIDFINWNSGDPAAMESALWSWSSKFSIGDARQRGLELGLIQSLNFMPGILRDFNIFANFAIISSQGSYGGKATDISQGLTRTLPGLIPRTANVGIGWQHSRCDFRLNWNWMDTYLQGNTTSTFSTIENQQYTAAYWTMDFSGRIKLTTRATLSISLTNITSNNKATYRANPKGGLLFRTETNALGFFGTAAIDINL